MMKRLTLFVILLFSSQLALANLSGDLEGKGLDFLTDPVKVNNLVILALESSENAQDIAGALKAAGISDIFAFNAMTGNNLGEGYAQASSDKWIPSDKAAEAVAKAYGVTVTDLLSRAAGFTLRVATGGGGNAGGGNNSAGNSVGGGGGGGGGTAGTGSTP